jgi:hypothetical protein
MPAIRRVDLELRIGAIASDKSLPARHTSSMEIKRASVEHRGLKCRSHVPVRRLLLVLSRLSQSTLRQHRRMERGDHAFNPDSPILVSNTPRILARALFWYELLSPDQAGSAGLCGRRNQLRESKPEPQRMRSCHSEFPLPGPRDNIPVQVPTFPQRFQT